MKKEIRPLHDSQQTARANKEQEREREREGEREMASELLPEGQRRL